MIAFLRKEHSLIPIFSINIKSLSFFYELSTNDIYVMHLIHTGSMGFWDLFGLSLGIKAQLL